MTDYYVKQCIECGEVMPVIENVCYCEGAVIKRKSNKEEYVLASSFHTRKWIGKRNRRDA